MLYKASLDPNTDEILNPDPEFWPNLDPDPELCYKFLDENCSKVESLNGKLLSSILHLLPLIFPIFNCAWIRISNTDPTSVPDPQH